MSQTLLTPSAIQAKDGSVARIQDKTSRVAKPGKGNPFVKFKVILEKFVAQISNLAENFESSDEDDDVIEIDAVKSEPILKTSGSLNSFSDRVATKMTQTLTNEFGLSALTSRRFNRNTDAPNSTTRLNNGQMVAKIQGLKPSSSSACLSGLSSSASDDETTDSESSSSTSNQLKSESSPNSLENQRTSNEAVCSSRFQQSMPPTVSESSIGFFSSRLIDSIQQDLRSIPQFAAKLMRHLFTKSELLASENALGPLRNNGALPLDPARIKMIRSIVQDKFDPSRDTWGLCVNRMISEIARMTRNMKRPAKPKRGKVQVLAHSKETVDLKQDEFYENNGLSFDEINHIYRHSLSIQNFAKNLMMHLFKESELVRCSNVYGRGVFGAKATGNPLDENKIKMIRQIVQMNTTFSKHLWQSCVNLMNINIAKIKGRAQLKAIRGRKN